MERMILNVKDIIGTFPVKKQKDGYLIDLSKKKGRLNLILKSKKEEGEYLINLKKEKGKLKIILMQKIIIEEKDRDFKKKYLLVLTKKGNKLNVVLTKYHGKS